MGVSAYNCQWLWWCEVLNEQSVTVFNIQLSVTNIVKEGVKNSRRGILILRGKAPFQAFSFTLGGRGGIKEKWKKGPKIGLMMAQNKTVILIRG